MEIISRENNKLIKSFLESLGYKKKTKSIGYYKTEIEGAILIYRFVDYTKNKRTTIQCDVGVTYKEIIKVWSLIDNRDPVIYITDPIISTSLANLISMDLPCYLWEICYLAGDEIKINENNLEHLKQSILTYGDRYLQRYSGSMDSIFEEAVSDPIIRKWKETLPILYYLRGEKQKGLEFIERVIEDMSTPRIAPDQKIIKEGNTEFYIMREEFSEKKLFELLKEYGAVQLGTGCDGVVDTNYLKFAEGYNALPNDVQGLLDSIQLKI